MAEERNWEASRLAVVVAEDTLAEEEEDEETEEEEEEDSSVEVDMAVTRGCASRGCCGTSIAGG